MTQEFIYVLGVLAIIAGVFAGLLLILKQIGVKNALSASVSLTCILLLGFFTIIYFKMLGS